MLRHVPHIMPHIRPSYFLRDHSGATAVEFAITAPVFLAFLYGVLEMGRAILTQGMLSYGVQQSARYATTHTNATTVQLTSELQRAFTGIDSGPASLAISETLKPDGTTEVNLSATYRFQPLTPLLGSEPIILNASSSAWR